MRFRTGKSAIALSLLTAGFLSFTNTLIAESEKPPAAPDAAPFPWFTGPLLTPAGHVIPNGHFNIQPYEFITPIYGLYDRSWQSHSKPKFYNLQTIVITQIGMPCSLDFTFIPAWSWNHIHGASHWTLNDMSFGFDYQLLNDKKGKWWPAVKLALRANLPIGKYQKLHPKSKKTAIGGSGSWQPGIGIVMSHLYWWGGKYFFAPRLSIQYTIPNSVHVKNLNAYGGGHHTRGTVYPGQSLTALFGFEISLSQRWAIANDIQYVHTNKTRFKGRKGATSGKPNRIGGPSSEQWSLAPAIEYNWTENYGILAGSWFTLAGRNAIEFASAVISINIYH